MTDGRSIQAFSSAAERAFGRSADDVLGQDFALALLPTQLRTRYRAGIDEAATGDAGPADKRVEITALRVDGSEFAAE